MRPGEGRHRGRLDVLLRDVPVAVRDRIQTTIEGAVSVEHATRPEWRDLDADPAGEAWTPHLRTKLKRGAALTVDAWLTRLDASRLSDERDFARDIRRLIRTA